MSHGPRQNARRTEEELPAACRTAPDPCPTSPPSRSRPCATPSAPARSLNAGARRASPISPTTHARVDAGSALRLRPRRARRRARLRARPRVERGAVALLVERPLDLPVPQLVVADARLAMALAADAFFGRPTRELEVAGVTGTNGKTTTAFLLYSILAAAGRRPGLLGTVEMRVGGERRAVTRTTPEAIDLQRTLPRAARRGRPQLRDGGLLARVRAEAPRRDALPRARLHEPLPGSPRLPRDARGVLRRQAAALHRARRRRQPASRRGQRRRRVRPPAGRRAARARRPRSSPSASPTTPTSVRRSSS